MKQYEIGGIILQPFHPNVPFLGEISEERGDITGRLYDTYGDSSISGTIDESLKQMSFSKKYDGSPTIIDYEFVKKGNLWIGDYRFYEELQGESLCELVMPGEEPKNNWGYITENAVFSEGGAEKLAQNLIKRMEKKGLITFSEDREIVQIIEKSKLN
ncbi:MAG: hypothetical protein KKC19_01120 [Nanoarchaeota archaeon]|nr:hypothetical protein [Nanoarchaeota archaeon]